MINNDFFKENELTGFSFRYMEVDDINEVLEIEKKSFTLAWTPEAYHNEININQFSSYIVLEHDGKIIGYCGSWIVVEQSHITNIAIDPNYRGYKLGEALLRQIMLLAIQKGAKTMSLEVRVSNKVAQNLYRKLGFQDGGIRKRYYSDNLEDALVMWVDLC